MSANSPRCRMLMLFVVGAVVRLCYWLATSDRTDAFAAGYQGDAPIWVDHAKPGTGGPIDIEWAIPFRPPGMAWITDLLTDGRSFVLARLSLVLLGALVAPIVYAVLRRGFEERVAFLAAGICAVSSGLVLLGSGLHSEVPYLVLFVLGVGDFERMRTSRQPLAAGRWALLQAAACLLRADHLAFVVLSLGWLAVRRTPHWLRHCGIVLGTMLLALAPWQWHAAQQIATANSAGFPGRSPPQLPLPGALPWDAAALRTLDSMPAFARLMAFRFIDDTMRSRGARRVSATDIAVLDEAYGTTPEPLTTPLLVLYGPLNFFLANSPESTGGFTRAALDRRPALRGGPSQYPRGLLQALPRNGPLCWDYPPHLKAINHGYRLGLDWVLAEPGHALSLIASKLAIAWRGVATGCGSYNLPLGMSGVREPVDIVVAVGPLAMLWRGALLALALLGLWCTRRRAAAASWLCWLAAKGITIALFFGYARLGALCTPTIALLLALAIDPLLARIGSAWRTNGSWLLLTSIVAIEVARCASAPTVRIESELAQPTSVAALHDRVQVHYQ